MVFYGKFNDKSLVRYRCRVGHAYGQEGLKTGINNEITESLWIALRAGEEMKQFLTLKNEPETKEELKKINQQLTLLKKILSI